MSILDIFTDSKFSKLINNFDISFTKVPSPNTIDNNDNLVGQAIKHAIDTDQSNVDDLSGIFNNIGVSPDRLMRYTTYNELFSAVQLIKRIVILYLNNLMQRDPITNDMLLVNYTEESEDLGESTQYKVFTKALLHFFNLEERIRVKTAADVLKFGDGFIETIDLDKIDVVFPRPKQKLNGNENKNNFNSTVLSENEFLSNLSKKNKYVKIDPIDITNLLDNYIDFTNEINLNLSLDEYITESNKGKKEKKESTYNFNRVMLKFHSPHSIIPIITEFDNIIGYIEISTVSTSMPNNKVNNLINFANMINQISNSSYVGGENKSEKTENTIGIFVDAIILKIFNKFVLSSDNKDDLKFSEEVKKKLKSDLYYSLKKMMINAKPDSLFKNKLNVRFISSENIFHFKNYGSGSYYPYGDSVIDPLIFPGKLYLLTQLANAVTRLSRSSIMRKWTIETGTREDVNSLLQKLKKNLKNQRITGDDIATSNNLPKILSDYKDMVTFKKKGTTFIDLDVLNSGDPNVNTRDLEDIRKELISLSGVPSSYLGYQDTIDLKDQLINANIVFANDISVIQKSFNDNITKLVQRIGEITGFDPSNKLTKHVKITLIPPTVLVLQNIEASINSISTIQRIFAEIPEIDVDPLYLLRRYCPLINWDEFEKEARDFKERKKVSTTANAASSNMPGGY